MTSAPPLIVFCDFDGTITEHDVVVSICKQFCPPEWQEVARDILARRKSVRVGVAEMFAMIPSSRRDEMLDYAMKTMRFRAGFAEFLRFCEENGIAFTVCSGGLDFFVDAIMAPYRSMIYKSYSIPTDFSGPTVRLSHPYGCETCGTCKVKVMDEYPKAIKILIGDGITDVHGAHHATRVFARDKLKGYLDQDGIPYEPFETFHDIIGSLSRFQGTTHEQSVR